MSITVLLFVNYDSDVSLAGYFSACHKDTLIATNSNLLRQKFMFSLNA